MARLVGVDLPRDKRLEVALTYIFGIGRTRALQTLKATGVSGDIRVHDLTDDDNADRHEVGEVHGGGGDDHDGGDPHDDDGTEMHGEGTCTPPAI